MIIELSEFFNNPSLIELGPLKIQYYAVSWLISALLIYFFLKQHKIIKEIGRGGFGAVMLAKHKVTG